MLKSADTRANLRHGIYRVVPVMRRPVRPGRFCPRCIFYGPSGECLDPARKSGRCGDWIWGVRNGKPIRRPYVKPHDPRTPAQLRSRARLSAASRKYSYSLTEKQRQGCIAAGAKRKTRPRLYQSGPMTGQQYSISKEYALQKAHGNAIRTFPAPQVPQPQLLKVTSWDRHRSATRVPPGCHRTNTRLGGKNQRDEKKSARHNTRGVKANQPLQSQRKQGLRRLSRKRRSDSLPVRGSRAGAPPAG